MAQVCPHCGSADTETLMNGIQCLNAACQRRTSYAKLAETPQSRPDREG